MGFVKRLGLFVFGLGGLLALAALVLPWFGPWTNEATALLGVDEYYVAVEILVVIAAVGCLACLLYSIFKRNRKTVVVSHSDGDEITVTRDAISSQAQHVIEEDGAFRARRVAVQARRHGHVRVYARVQPMATVDVVASGAELHDRLMTGLATVCGDNVDSVDLEFVNAAEYASSTDDTFAFGAASAGAPDAFSEAAANEDMGIGDGDASANTQDSGSEITVPMARYAAAEDETEGE